MVDTAATVTHISGHVPGQTIPSGGPATLHTITTGHSSANLHSGTPAISLGASRATTLNSFGPARQNDEVTRGIFNLKMLVFLLLLPVVLLMVVLKHLLDYLFSLRLKEKDVNGKVALVSLFRAITL